MSFLTLSKVKGLKVVSAGDSEADNVSGTGEEVQVTEVVGVAVGGHAVIDLSRVQAMLCQLFQKDETIIIY